MTAVNEKEYELNDVNLQGKLFDLDVISDCVFDSDNINHHLM